MRRVFLMTPMNPYLKCRTVLDVPPYAAISKRPSEATDAPTELAVRSDLNLPAEVGPGSISLFPVFHFSCN
jgi:hypothetical protein